MPDPERESHLGIRWPDSYRELLPVVRQRWHLEDIYLSRKLSGGKSGALVFAVDVSSPDFTGQAILKLDQATDPGGQEQHEADLHSQAIEDSPQFALGHLPRVLYSLSHRGNIAILSTIAGRGLEYAEPWIECAHDRQLEAIRNVSVGLLEGWNGDYHLQSGMLMPQALMESWIGRRLHPQTGGRIHSLLKDESGLAPDVPTFMFEGHWFPNPLAFSDGSIELPDRLRLRGAVGHCHGDFHGRNLLIGGRGGGAADYFLIDLAMYESQQFLFFDHAYFELATLLYFRGDAAGAQWDAAVGQLSRYRHHNEGRGPQVEDVGLIELMRALRAGEGDWIEKHEGDRLSYMENQVTLARVAAGLNFSHKRALSLENRQRAFLYAATNLKDYLSLNRLDWPKTGPELVLRDPSAEVVVTQAKPDPTPPPLSAAQDGPSGRGSGVLSELLRRNVVRVAGLYAILAWIVILIVDRSAASLDFPARTGSVVAALFAVGFPVVCILAWIFNAGERGLWRMTPDSKSGTNPISIVDYTMALAILVVLALGMHTYGPWLDRSSRSAAGSGDVVSVSGPAEATSLAVLPFTNVGGGDDAFVDGLTIEIFNVLAATGAFRMPAVTSVFRYKGRADDLREIGRALNVDYLVEGTVRKSGEDLRIETFLVRSDDGFVIWSEKFRETMANVFFLQERIALDVGEALSTPLDIDADVLTAQRSADPEAYDLFIRGLALLAQRGPALRDAMAALQRAVEIRPDFAAAWAALSLTYNSIPRYMREINGERISPRDFYDKARDAALRAQEIDPDLPAVHHAIGNMHQRNREWADAEKAYQAALVSDPNDHSVMQDYAALLQTIGRRQEALETIRRAQSLDPLNELYNIWAAFLGWQLQGNINDIDTIKEMFQTYRQFRPFTARIMIDHDAMNGQLDQAREMIETCSTCTRNLREGTLSMIDAANREPARDIFETFKNRTFMGYRFLYAVGGADLALEAFAYTGLEAERRPQYFSVPWSLVDEIGSDPRFAETLNRMGLVDYWRENGWPEICQPTEDGGFACG